MSCMQDYGDEYEICPHCGYIENSEPEEANQLRPGTILHNKYVVGKAIGHGGFGITYVGFDAELERKVAVKEYMPSEFSNRIPGDDKVIVYEGEKREQFESGLAKFTEEAKRLAMFQDKEGIIQIYDCFLENNTAYLIMEYLDGETVKEKIRRDGRMGLEEAIGVIMPILRSLKEVNAVGILHRDIAPDNIMLTSEGEAKLIDFGASRFATTGHSRSLSVLIKQGYAPVEQYNSRGDQGTWTDVYGLAATFYFLLTGKTPQDAMERKARDLMKAPSKEGAEVKKNVDIAIMNALNIGIEYRTKTMEDFEKELLSIDEVARVVEPEHREDLGRMPKWMKVTLGAATSLILVFGLLLITGVINFGGLASGVFQMAQGNTYVPTFINQVYANAGDIAERNHLQIQIVDSRFSDEIEKEMVLSQSLPSGSEVAINSMVDLVVSAGREQAEVPSLLGLDLEEAVRLLTEAGLDYETKEVDNNAVADSVVSQSYEAMSLVDKGTKVVLEISNGNLGEIDREAEVMMPNLVEKKYEDAQKQLQELGLQVARKTQYNSDVREGYIISQSEPDGKILHQGDLVELTVSLGRKKVNVPYVIFKSEEEAKKTLEALGLIVTITYENSQEVQKGNVIAQSIAEDTQVEVGNLITLKVSSGPKETMVAQASSAPTTMPTSTPAQTIAPTLAPTQAPTSAPTPEPQWSDWVESMPSNVTAANYTIEQKTQYSYRDKSYLNSSDESPAGQGYTLESKTPVYSDYGDWSGWSTTAQSETELIKVEKQTWYSYRDKIIKEEQYWGDWSDWQNDSVEGSATREVQTQVISATYKTQYNYSRYLSSDGWGGPWVGTWSGHYCHIYRERGWSDNPLGVSESQWSNGTQFNVYGDGGQFWYNETTRQVEVTPAYTQYKYRDLKTSVTESWGSWTEYSSTSVSGSSTREVRTQDYYRSATRTVSYTYRYWKWSEWTGYSDTASAQNSTREVRTRTLYRYKQK